MYPPGLPVCRYVSFRFWLYTEKEFMQESGGYMSYFKRSKRGFSLQEIQCLRNLMREGIPERIRWS